jgi:DNA-binding cell septation regulator SpoVG
MTATHAATRTTWDHRPAPTAKAAVKVYKINPIRRGPLRGFFSVKLPSGLVLHSCKLMRSANGHWVALPALPQLDADGRHKTDPNGKKLYTPAAEIPDRSAAARFHDQVIAAIERDAPELLAEDGNAP